MVDYEFFEIGTRFLEAVDGTVISSKKRERDRGELKSVPENEDDHLLTPVRARQLGSGETMSFRLEGGSE